MMQEEVDKSNLVWKTLKEYIFVLDSVDDHMVPVVVAHAVLTAHTKFHEDRLYDHWLKYSYKKCVCKVNSAEMLKVLSTEGVSTTTESNYGNTIVAAVMCPRIINPNVAKYAKLWKPNYEIRSSLV